MRHNCILKFIKLARLVNRTKMLKVTRMTILGLGNRSSFVTLTRFLATYWPSQTDQSKRCRVAKARPDRLFRSFIFAELNLFGCCPCYLMLLRRHQWRSQLNFSSFSLAGICTDSNVDLRRTCVKIVFLKKLFEWPLFFFARMSEKKI